MPMRKATENEIKLFNQCCKEYNDLELKKDEVDELINNIKF